jgi:probable phosphoglycerate mutase
MPTPTIYHIRHGETDWNVAGRLQGHRDIPMNARGLLQAAAAGDVLKDLLAREGRSPTELAYVSSPLGRATATMNLVRAELRLPAEGYSCDDRLREISYGEWEGLTAAEMQVRDPEVYGTRGRDKWGTAPPAGESYAELARRVGDWYAEVNEDTIVSAHGGTTRVLMVITGVARPDDVVDLRIEQGVIYVFAGGKLAKYGSKYG